MFCPTNLTVHGKQWAHVQKPEAQLVYYFQWSTGLCLVLDANRFSEEHVVYSPFKGPVPWLQVKKTWLTIAHIQFKLNSEGLFMLDID